MNLADRPHVGYCLKSGAMSQVDVDRLLSFLECRPRIQSIAREFGTTTMDMAVSALDAGLAFLRVCILSSDADALFSPAPIADEGWDAMSDNSDERAFYEALCRRLCELAKVASVVPEHYRFSDNERLVAHELGAVANAIAAMEGFGLEYVSEYWPEGGGECGSSGALACRSLLMAGAS